MELVLNNPPPPLNHEWEKSAMEKTAAVGLVRVLIGEEQYASAETFLARGRGRDRARPSIKTRIFMKVSHDLSQGHHGR
jgi:hypothetical protein